MTKCPVIFDCDGVLLNWEEGFRSWAEAAYPSFKFKGDYPESWDLSEWIGCTKNQAMLMIDQFNRSEFFGRLLPMPYAARTLYEVQRADHPIYVLTSCSSEFQVQERRKQNLADRFNVEIQRTICLDLGVRKLDVLKGFYAIFGECIWIEDNFDNALDGARTGHKTFFIHRPHNSAYWETELDRIKHLDCLRDLMSHIK